MDTDQAGEIGAPSQYENASEATSKHGTLISINAPNAAALRRFILELVPQDGTTAGNKYLRTEIRRRHPSLGDDVYFRVRDQLVADGILEKRRGKGGSVCLAGFDLSPENARSRLRIRHPSEINAVLMRHADDDAPEYLGRAFVDNMGDPYQRALCAQYSEISTRHRETGGGPYLACHACHQPIYVRGIRQSHGRTLFHRRNADSHCPLKSKNAQSKSEVLGEMYPTDDNLSEAHEAAVRLICDTLLESCPPLTPGDEVLHDSASERPAWRLDGGIRLNRAMHAHDRSGYRRPDIAFTLVDETGYSASWVIEVQRSSILRDDILSRSEFYRRRGTNLLWVMIDNLLEAPGAEVAKHFADVHRGSQILLDDAAMDAITATGRLYFSSQILRYARDDMTLDVSTEASETSLLLFPDDLVVRNHHVFPRDIVGEAITTRLDDNRREAAQILTTMSSRPDGSARREVQQERYANGSRSAKELISRICAEIENAPDFEPPDLGSRGWRTISVLLTMIARLKTGKAGINYTSSWETKGPLLLTFNPAQALYPFIVQSFACASGYADLHRELVCPNDLYMPNPKLAEAEYRAMPTGEKWLFKTLLGEAFDPAARAILSAVSGLPDWAVTSPFETSPETCQEVA